MEDNIKILLIQTYNFFEKDGASSNRWRTMVEGLSKAGIQIQIVFTQGYSSVRELRKYGRKGSINNITYLYSIILFQNTLMMRRIASYVLFPMLRFVNSIRIRNLIEKGAFHIIWIPSVIDIFDIYLNATSLKRDPPYKLMLELNEYDDIAFVQSTNLVHRKISKRFSQVLLYNILPQADLLLIMTQHLLEYYRKFTNPDKVSILHLPMTVDLDRFRMKKNSKVRYAAYCGSSSFIKDGIDILIKSFLIISNRFPDIRLKIAAFMEADGRKMLAMIKDLNLQDKVDYVGELKREDIPEFITNAELLLLPRPDSRQAQGGFPTKLGEYLASGNPVCVTKVGEIPDYLCDNVSAFMAVPGSVDSFAEAMVRALSNPELAKKVGANGRLVAENHFNMNIQSEKLFSFLYSEINI